MSNTATGPSNPLQHRLVYDDLQMARHPWIREIDSAIRKNPDCETGLMARQGWAYSDNGPNSDGDRPELLVWLAQGLIRRAPADNGWFGHVFFRDDRDGSTSKPSGKWVSMLVRTGARPDGTDPDQVLHQWRSLVVTGHRWVPGYFHSREDTCARRSSFQDALRVLITQIRNFRRINQEEKLVGYDDYGDFKFPLYEDPDGGTQDLRPMGIYRFSSQLCAEFAKDYER